MEVVPMNLPRRNSPAGTLGLPFNKRNVEEWSRLDRLTGMMETAKIETDHWAARSNNAAHKYGKMIDSRERNNKDGSLQQRHRKQMEVFETQVPGGSMQVIRTQTVTTSSKSSKWMSSNEKGFEDLKLPINSLDLSSQKTKGSVGRSGSIGGRRPPSRPRSLISQSSSNSIFGEDSSVSRLCQRLHDQVKNDIFKSFNDFTDHTSSFNGFSVESDSDEQSGVEITEITNSSSDNYSHSNLNRQKSCSNENVAIEKEDDNTIKRTSKIRRSLQFPKQTHSYSESTAQENEWGCGKSLKERAAEIENLLRRGSSTATTISQDSDKSLESLEKVKTIKTRDSFVSAETLKEVRDRLKKANATDELKDDGIVTEKEETNDLPSKVKCFVYGMEALMSGNKNTKINGTGSLESRSSCKNSGNGSRSEEWYKRRKSYGFEQVEEPNKFEKFNNRKNVESSTDSGICQSSETVGTPTWNKYLPSKLDTYVRSPTSTIVTLGAKKESNSYQSPEKSVNSVYLENSTPNVFSVRVEDTRKDENRKQMFRRYDEQSETVWNRKSPIPVKRNTDVRESLKSSLRSAKNPWISQLRGTKLVDRNWLADEQNDSEDNKLSSDEKIEESKRTSSPFEDSKLDSDSSNNQKKNKKVEFCKTEVHFAAEPGKFNIVETDGKPPPNDIFRRRRRNSGSVLTKNTSGLPEIKFGDSIYEKRLLTNSSDKTESISEKIEAELKELSKIVADTLPIPKEPSEDGFKNPTSPRLYDVAEEPNDENCHCDLRPRSILKNYRKSFLLGENENSTNDRTSPTTPVWKSTVILRNKRFDDLKNRNTDDSKLYSSDGETELQIRFRNLRKIDPDQKKWWESDENSVKKPDEQKEVKRRSLPDDILLRNGENSYGNTKTTVSSDEIPFLSVAERVKQVEELKSNNFSSKINFRSGEMTVIQNGTGNNSERITIKDSSWNDRSANVLPENRNWEDRKEKNVTCEFSGGKAGEKKRKMTKGSQEEAKMIRYDVWQNLYAFFFTDNITTSNPTVMRLPTNTQKTDNTDNNSQKYQTTRILINFHTSPQNESNSTTEKSKPNNINKSSTRLINSYGSWSPGMKKDLSRYFADLKSTSLVRETLNGSQEGSSSQQREDIPKPSKPIHEIIDKFDSLSLPSRRNKEKRRKTMPINYKAPKEYTHADLEEELKNFTENLDKDFKDIYEEEIGSLRGSIKQIYEPVKPVIVNRSSYDTLLKSSSEDGSKKSFTAKINYDSDDSDLLADEEVRSYMSTGQGGTDSEPEDNYGSWSSRKSFQESIQRFKKLEVNGCKDVKKDYASLKSLSSYGSYSSKSEKSTNTQPEQPKIASISLRYEDDPLFAKTAYKTPIKTTRTNGSGASVADEREKTSSPKSKPRERATYLNGLSLSEKYSNYLRSSNSSLDNLDTNYSIKSITEPNGNRTKEWELNKSDYVASKPKEIKRSEVKEEKIKKEIKPIRYSEKTATQDYLSKYRAKTEISKNLLGDKKKLPLEKKKKSKERDETDSGILEELTRAADEILIAVNGYTDDDSHLASSEDDDKSRKIIKKNKISNLSTISEGKRVTKTETRRSTHLNTARRSTGNQSSASSLESLTKESTHRSSRNEVKVCPRLKNAETTKPLSNRATRLLQRASSREALMPQPSSSEDIPSYVEIPKKRTIRRQKSSSSVKSDLSTDSKTNCRVKSRTKGAETSTVTRVRDRKSTALKDSTSITKNRTSHAAEIERTKPITRKTAVEKIDSETARRKRILQNHHKEEQPSLSLHKSKPSRVNVKKLEAFKT